MKKYGLQLRVPPSQQKKPPSRPPLARPAGFGDDDDDSNDIEGAILRQASKNKSLRDIEEQHKKALEEDPSVFDYDGVYDEMKEKVNRPRVEDREEKKPKYIHNLIRKAEQRKWEHEIVYERKLAKERSKEDHLYAAKDKFVTSAYKKKLAEQAKWMEEERIRQLREEKEDVTKKSDLSEFYFNLNKNVAFGARDAMPRQLDKHAESSEPRKREDKEADTADGVWSPPKSNIPKESTSSSERQLGERPRERLEPSTSGSISEERVPSTPVDPSADQPSTVQVDPSADQSSADQAKRDHHKRSEDAVAAARERFLARKRAKNSEL